VTHLRQLMLEELRRRNLRRFNHPLVPSRVEHFIATSTADPISLGPTHSRVSGSALH